MNVFFTLLGIATLLGIVLMTGNALVGPFLDAFTDNRLDQITLSGKLAGIAGCVICLVAMFCAVAVVQNCL